MNDVLSNLEVVRRFAEDGLGKADMAAFDATVAEDVVVETGLSPARPIVGRENYKAIYAGFAECWPVRKFRTDEIFGADDKVVLRFTATAAFIKDYYGVAATRQIADLKEVHLLTLRDGKIVHNIVSGTNFPFEYIMYPALKDAVIGSLPVAE